MQLQGFANLPIIIVPIIIQSSSIKIFEAVMKLNNMPRKSLGYRTPYEEFCNINVVLQT